MLEIFIKRSIGLSIVTEYGVGFSHRLVLNFVISQHFFSNIAVYLIIETCLYVKGTLSSRNHRVTAGMIDRL